MKPTRKVILIGTPGAGRTFLSGVKKDLDNMELFLQSNEGGAFDEGEIIRLPLSPTKEDIGKLASIQVDYCIVYFSGHGCLSEDGVQLLSVRNGCTSIQCLINKSPRQLIIIDACRKRSDFHFPPIHIPGECLNFDGEHPERDLFDEYILKSPHGITLVQSTQLNDLSVDIANQGGAFTTMLIDLSLKQVSRTITKPVFMREIVSQTAKEIGSLGLLQRPVVEPLLGNLQVPFALALPKSEKMQQPSQQSLSTTRPLRTIAVIACVIVVAVLVIAALSKNGMQQA